MTCPWHCTKISITTGEALYESFDVQTSSCEPTKKDGARQRVHEVIIQGDDVCPALPCSALSLFLCGTVHERALYFKPTFFCSSLATFAPLGLHAPPWFAWHSAWHPT